jgi:curved DNA-binding protein CbpA
MKGLLSDGVLPGLLRDVYVNRRSGRLALVRGQEQYLVHFGEGRILCCESSQAGSRLGQLMVANGLLPEAARREAAEVVRRTGRRLGEVLVEMGAIDKSALEDALAMQVREHLLRVFGWTDGICGFQEGGSTGEAPVTLKLSTAEMIMEAVRLARNAAALRENLGDLDRVVIPSTDPLLRFQRVTLTPADGFVLSRVDGTATARELLQMVPLPAEEAERSLFGLLCIGMVEYLPPATELRATSAEQRRAEILAAFEALATRDHFEVLGVPRDASQADVTAAFHRRARRFHPDAHHDPALRDLRERLDAIFARLGEAWETLRTPTLRRDYVSSLDRAARAPAAAVEEAPPESAEDAARRAEAALAMADERARDGRHWEAIGLLEGLVAVTRGGLRRRARLMLADLYANNPRAGKSVEEQLLAVIEENPDNVDARLRLARLYRDRQLRPRALEYARQALELRPGLRAAQELIDELDGGKGVVRRLFRS